jgi:hypothetical protein
MAISERFDIGVKSPTELIIGTLRIPSEVLKKR